MSYEDRLNRFHLITKMRDGGSSYREIGNEIGVSKVRVMQILMDGKPKERLVTERGGYVNKDLSICTNKLTGERMTLTHHCELYGFEGRDYPREKVRVAYGHTCQGCGVFRHPSMLDKKEGQKSLDIHHIGGLCGKKSRKYDRVCDLTKMIPLCHKCHFNHPEHRMAKTKYKKVNKKMEKQIKQMRAAGLSMDEISYRVGVSYPSVRKTLKKLSTDK